MLRSLFLGTLLALIVFIGFGEVETVSAQGIVTCGHEISGDRFTYDCGTCELIEMANIVIDFVIRLMLVFTAILFAIAGYWLVTSRGNSGEYTRAKNLLTNVIIGLIIMLCAWLMVDTVMKLLLTGGQVQYLPGEFGPWNEIKCTTNVPTKDGAVTEQGVTEDWLNDETWRRYLTANKLNEIEFSATEIAGMATDLNGMTYNNAICAQARSVGLGDYCSILMAQMYVESGGKPGAVSPAGAAGIMQIMPDTARGLDPALLGSMSDAQVTQYLKDNPYYSIKLGVEYFSRGLDAAGGDVRDALAYYNGGPRALNDSKTCPGQDWWECTANSGYKETRNYVNNILALSNKAVVPSGPQ